MLCLRREFREDQLKGGARGFDPYLSCEKDPHRCVQFREGQLCCHKEIPRAYLHPVRPRGLSELGDGGGAEITRQAIDVPGETGGDVRGRALDTNPPLVEIDHFVTPLGLIEIAGGYHDGH